MVSLWLDFSLIFASNSCMHRWCNDTIICLWQRANNLNRILYDEVAEWLRRWTANPLCSARVGSNPILVAGSFWGQCHDSGLVAPGDLYCLGQDNSDLNLVYNGQCDLSVWMHVVGSREILEKCWEARTSYILVIILVLNTRTCQHHECGHMWRMGLDGKVLLYYGPAFSCEHAVCRSCVASVV